MIKVYFETKHLAELVAVFEDDSVYSLCFPALEKEAEKREMILTESVEDFKTIEETAKEYFSEVEQEMSNKLFSEGERNYQNGWEDGFNSMLHFIKNRR